jgi:hypothetical protein
MRIRPLGWPQQRHSHMGSTATPDKRTGKAVGSFLTRGDGYKPPGRTHSRDRRSDGRQVFVAQNRPRLNVTLSVGCHEALVQLSQATDLPRAHLIEAALAVATTHPTEFRALLAQLQDVDPADLYASSLALVAEQQRPEQASAPCPDPEGRRAAGLEMLAAGRRSDGTWPRGTFSRIGRALGVGRSTVHSWAAQLRQ